MPKRLPLTNVSSSKTCVTQTNLIFEVLYASGSSPCSKQACLRSVGMGPRTHCHSLNRLPCAFRAVRSFVIHLTCLRMPFFYSPFRWIYSKKQLVCFTGAFLRSPKYPRLARPGRLNSARYWLLAPISVILGVPRAGRGVMGNLNSPRFENIPWLRDSIGQANNVGWYSGARGHPDVFRAHRLRLSTLRAGGGLDARPDFN